MTEVLHRSNGPLAETIGGWSLGCCGLTLVGVMQVIGSVGSCARRLVLNGQGSLFASSRMSRTECDVVVLYQPRVAVDALTRARSGTPTLSQARVSGAHDSFAEGRTTSGWSRLSF